MWLLSHLRYIRRFIVASSLHIEKKSGIQIKSICFHTIRHRLKIIITYHSYSSGNIETVSYVWIDKESSLRWGLVSSSQVKYYTSSRSCGSKWVHMPTLITCILTSWFLTLYLFFIEYAQNVMSQFQPIKLFNEIQTIFWKSSLYKKLCTFYF